MAGGIVVSLGAGGAASATGDAPWERLLRPAQKASSAEAVRYVRTALNAVSRAGNSSELANLCEWCEACLKRASQVEGETRLQWAALQNMRTAVGYLEAATQAPLPGLLYQAAYMLGYVNAQLDEARQEARLRRGKAPRPAPVTEAILDVAKALDTRSAAEIVRGLKRLRGQETSERNVRRVLAKHRT